jgi:thiol-disulfide isomerase/thioredoxin
MNPNTRRLTLYALAAVAASAAGLAWKHRDRQAAASADPAPASPPAADPALADFWQREYDTPTGGRLATRSLQGKPLVLNFWATWCGPCVKEMPELDRFAQDMAGQGWQVLGVAIDKADAVRSFLQTTPVRFPIAVAGLDGLGLVQALGNTNGGLPFTLVLDAQGLVLQRKMGATHYDELLKLAQQARPS